MSYYFDIIEAVINMKVNRLMEIIIILLNRTTVTSKELAERFEVSQRTIYRDIEELSSAGIPVYMSKGKGGGISLLENYTLNKAILSDDEKNSIIFALETLETTKQLRINSTLEKLKGVFGNSGYVDWVDVDFAYWGSSKEVNIRFEEIKSAILKQKILKFKYVNAKNIKSDRMVKPYKIIFKGQAWYLWAFCCDKKLPRLFKITRMREVKSVTTSFQREELSVFFQEVEEHQELNMIKLKLRFSENMFYRIVDYFNEDEILQESAGTYLVTTEFPYSEWVYSYILSFGNNVEVAEPLFIRKEVGKRIQSMLKKYNLS